MIRATFQSVMCDPTGDGSHRVVARVANDDSIPDSERMATLGTLEFIAPQGADLGPFEPGMYLTVRVTEGKTPGDPQAVTAENSGGIPSTPRTDVAPADVPSSTPPLAGVSA